MKVYLAGTYLVPKVYLIGLRFPSTNSFALRSTVAFKMLTYVAPIR